MVLAQFLANDARRGMGFGHAAIPASAGTLLVLSRTVPTAQRDGQRMSMEQIAAQTYVAPGRPGGWFALTGMAASETLRRHAIRVASALTLVALWFLAAFVLPPSVMPGPPAVVRALWADMLEGSIWTDVAITLGRIASAFVIAMILGLVFGFAMGLSRAAANFFDVWIICGITVPSLVTILTIFMIGGLNERSAILGAAIPIVPVLTINIWQGIKSVDQKLIEMGRAFRADRNHIVRSIIAPQIAPVMIASSRFGLGLIWKMVLFVELLGRSDGVGYKIEFYYQLFNMTEVLAHALLFLMIMLAIEFLLLGRIEKRVFRWRPAG